MEQGLKRVPILLLASGIEDVEERYLVVDDTLLPVRVWRGRTLEKRSRDQEMEALGSVQMQMVPVEFEMALSQRVCSPSIVGSYSSTK